MAQHMMNGKLRRLVRTAEQGKLALIYMWAIAGYNKGLVE